MTQPESKTKLAEKLGFRIGVPAGAHPEAFDVIYNNGRESDWATPAEIALWNLCLDLSAELEKAEKERDEYGDHLVEQVFQEPAFQQIIALADEIELPELLDEAERLADKEKKA